MSFPKNNLQTFGTEFFLVPKGRPDKKMQKENLTRTLIRFYEIFQKNHSHISFTQMCDRYILAHFEVIEIEKQLGDKATEIQLDYQDWGEEQFTSKYVGGEIIVK